MELALSLLCCFVVFMRLGLPGARLSARNCECCVGGSMIYSDPPVPRLSYWMAAVRPPGLSEAGVGCVYLVEEASCGREVPNFYFLARVRSNEDSEGTCQSQLRPWEPTGLPDGQVPAGLQKV